MNEVRAAVIVRNPNVNGGRKKAVRLFLFFFAAVVFALLFYFSSFETQAAITFRS